MPCLANLVRCLCFTLTSVLFVLVHRFKIPVDWLTDALNDIGLDTYVQNYSFRYPHNIYQDQVSLTYTH